MKAQVGFSVAQTHDADGVRVERSGWRDEEISRRHRTWGYDCPVADIDWLVIEYNAAIPAAVVEYKKYTAAKVDVNAPTYLAIKRLANWAKLPFWVAIYWPETWAFKVFPMNDLAVEFFTYAEPLSEQEYVRRIYLVRSKQIDTRLLPKLNNQYPEEEDPGANPG